MNKQQLLIAAITTAFCGMDLLAENIQRPNVDILKKISQSIQYGCEENLTSECIALITYLEEAERHIIQLNKKSSLAKYDIPSIIISLEDQKKELQKKGSPHPFINELIEEDLKGAQDFLADCNKKYLDTLTPEQYQKFKSVVSTVVKEHIHPSVWSIGYTLIAEALEK